MKTYNKDIYIDKGDGIKRYRLGHMDMYSVAVRNTPMENSSFYQAYFDEPLDYNKLVNSINEAIKYHPLFGCKLVFDNEFYLQENHEDVSKVIKKCSVEDRPKEFGSLDSTNGYLFQICLFDNYVSFEWSHAVSDGRGSLAFFISILEIYFGKDLGEVPKEFNLKLPYEEIYNPSIKSLGQIKQPKGFKSSSIKKIKNGYKCNSTVIKIDTSQILKLSKRMDATPVAVLVPLFCKAIRMSLDPNATNKNVSCGIVIDIRKAIDINTMHNCVTNKVVTYTDRLDKLRLEDQATIYRSILDLYLMSNNLIADTSKMLDDVDSLYRLKPLFLEQTIMKVVAPIVKTSMNNIGCTYIGRLNLSDTLARKMKDFRFRSWPDIGDAVFAVVDLNGTLIIDFTDNYVDRSVVTNFISLCKENGIDAQVADKLVFEQANVRIKF